ncbi:MAG: hypothetical protein AB7G93_03700 [Bdellovibrionales bacterium]
MNSARGAIFTALATLLTTFAHTAAAETAELRISGDLMVRPAQMESVFLHAMEKIKTSSGWSWSRLEFEKPYRTLWQNVQARGPFTVQFQTQDLNAQEMGFELRWADPLVNVGQFEIHDTVTRERGHTRIVIHLDGTCSNMQMRIPGGDWRIRGRVRWAFSGSTVQLEWLDFQFLRNEAAAGEVNIGQCEGPAGLHEALLEAIHVVSEDTAWIQDLMKEGLLEWVRGELEGLQKELLAPREFEPRTGLILSWRPESMLGVGAGSLRIRGQMVVSKAASQGQGFSEILERSYQDEDLVTGSDSGFVLPQGTLSRVLDYLYRVGELRYRVNSSTVESFRSLMQNRLVQFLVWPDLMGFHEDTQFWFDLVPSKVPALKGGKTLTSGAISYGFDVPMKMRQWAPTATQYLPYVDFSGRFHGTLEAYVKDRNLMLQLRPSEWTSYYNMVLAAAFRGEFARTRTVNTWMALSLIGSQVVDYLSTTPFQMELPVWPVGENLSLGVKSLQIGERTFHIPLEFKTDVQK